jgi:hypothetical protein
MKFSPIIASVYAALRISHSSALNISEINGNRAHRYLSSYAEHNVTAVKDLVTARGPRFKFSFCTVFIEAF